MTRSKTEPGRLFPEIRVPIPPERKEPPPIDPNPEIDACAICHSPNLRSFVVDRIHTHRCSWCGHVGTPIRMLTSNVIVRLTGGPE